jgi:hypothetical protein
MENRKLDRTPLLVLKPKPANEGKNKRRGGGA